ncbi:MAG: hypothetical protein C4325_05770 [Blastocatellia bacterium]
MELLIPGLILVALMVWASTKIKRISAAAFEAEKIQMSLYSIFKPSGFLHILNDESGLDFRAYSREMESIGNRDFYAAQIEVEVFESKCLANRIAEIRKNFSEATCSNYLDGGEKSAFVQLLREDGTVRYRETRKIVSRGDRLLELRVSVLEQKLDQFRSAIEQVLDGFLPNS